MKGSMLVMNKFLLVRAAFITVAIAAVVSSCSDKRSTGWEFAPNMYIPKAYNPDQPNPNFKNGLTAQLPPEGTMPVGFDKTEEYPNTPEGYQAAILSLSNPLPVTFL